MPNKRDLQLSKYGISKFKYRELCYFCMQYHEKKNLLKNITFLKAASANNMPKSNSINSQTEKNALKIAELISDIEMIEKSAIEADASISEYIITNVTQGVSYEYLNVPCGRRQFYHSRRKFFYLLSQKR